MNFFYCDYYEDILNNNLFTKLKKIMEIFFSNVKLMLLLDIMDVLIYLLKLSLKYHYSYYFII